MDNYLFIAEKPELGRAIAEALEGKISKGEGYIKVGNNTVTWCFGHLLELKEPSEYNQDYKKWDLDILPFKIPSMQYKPSKDKTKQIKIIKELIKESSVVVHAGDPDD